MLAGRGHQLPKEFVTFELRTFPLLSNLVPGGIQCELSHVCSQQAAYRSWIDGDCINTEFCQRKGGRFCLDSVTCLKPIGFCHCHMVRRLTRNNEDRFECACSCLRLGYQVTNTGRENCYDSSFVGTVFGQDYVRK